MMSKLPAQSALPQIVSPGGMMPDDGRVAPVPETSSGGFPGPDMHKARTWFSTAWAAYLRANFNTSALAARAFAVDERTARDWWHGRAAPSGVFVAHAFRLTPDEATRRLVGLGAKSQPDQDRGQARPDTAECRMPCREISRGRFGRERHAARSGNRGVRAMMRTAMVALALARPAAAQDCGPRDAVVAQLADQYGESRRGIGLAGSAAVTELFVSDTGTWTVVVTLPDGQACLLASGAGWETLSDALPPKGIDG